MQTQFDELFQNSPCLSWPQNENWEVIEKQNKSKNFELKTNQLYFHKKLKLDKYVSNQCEIIKYFDRVKSAVNVNDNQVKDFLLDLSKSSKQK